MSDDIFVVWTNSHHIRIYRLTYDHFLGRAYHLNVHKVVNGGLPKKERENSEMFPFDDVIMEI